MNDEERIRDYLRRRADVAVPDDLQWPAAAPVARRPWATLVSRTSVLALSALVLAVVAVGAFLGLQRPTGPASSSGAPDVVFPSEVAGMPVVTVARAAKLLQAGDLDGRVIAVAGFYNTFDSSCPAPVDYIGPLETWCSFSAFTDTSAGAQLCEPYGSNGISCHEPIGTSINPFFMSESSGTPWLWLTGGAAGAPAALVLIGHAGDARQWQCPVATQATCAQAFVVDRIAWAAGHDVPVAAPETGDQQTGAPITPKMSLTQVAAVVGATDDLLTGAPFRAGDIATVDPRWNLSGDNIVWVVRSLGPGAAPHGDETRSATVWLADDATGKVIDSHPLLVDPAYQPARLWQSATIHGLGCCTTKLAWERVAAADGTVVYEGRIPGGESGGADTSMFGGGYGSPPLVLPTGTYTISFWLANNALVAPEQACSTDVTLGLLGDARLNADFPWGAACTIGPAPATTPGP